MRGYGLRFCSVTCRNRHVNAARWTGLPPRVVRRCERCGGNILGRGLRFCSYSCRNENNGRVARERMLARPIAPRLKGAPRLGPGAWSAAETAYLVERYAIDGGALVAARLGRSVGSIHNKAYSLSLVLTPETRRRLAYDPNGPRMRATNPMHAATTRAKVATWRRTHPEEAAAVHAAMLRGHQRLQRSKPSGPEIRLRALLTELGVAFEPAALIKPRFIVDARVGDLIIQVDGEYWHGHPRFEPLTDRQQAQRRRDAAQDAYLAACGLRVARIWASELTSDRLRQVLNLPS